MKKMLVLVLALVLCAIALSACKIGNRQIGFDTTQTFKYAIIQLGNGELIEGNIETWRDFSESNEVQITINGITYLTSYENVIMATEKF